MEAETVEGGRGVGAEPGEGARGVERKRAKGLSQQTKNRST
jgi:hypothetical protein